MHDIELYKSTFAAVQTDVTIKMEDYKRMKKTNRLIIKTVIAAAIISLLLTGTIVAYATGMFGVRNLVIREWTEPAPVTDPAPETAQVSDTDTATRENNTDGEEGFAEVKPFSTTIISLQGFSDSIEYKATMEWLEYYWGYDPDWEILRSIGDNDTGLDRIYWAYNCYTQEMADKVDEIAAKYGLSLLEMPSHTYQSNEELFGLAGTGDFLGTANHVGSGYIFGSGTFQFDGDAFLDGIGEVVYQFRNSNKGVLDYVVLGIGDIDAFEERTYVTSGGTTVIIASGPHVSLLIADLDNSFVCLNVLTAGFTLDALEELAETIDFATLNELE